MGGDTLEGALKMNYFDDIVSFIVAASVVFGATSVGIAALAFTF